MKKMVWVILLAMVAGLFFTQAALADPADVGTQLELQQAIDTNKTPITLTADITLTSSLKVNKSVTIQSDGTRRKLNCNAGSQITYIQLSNDATLSNLDIVWTGSTGTPTLIQISGSATVTGCNISGETLTDSIGAVGIYAGGAGPIHIMNNTLNKLYTPMMLSSALSGETSVSNNTITGSYSMEVARTAIDSLNNNSFSGQIGSGYGIAIMDTGVVQSAKDLPETSVDNQNVLIADRKFKVSAQGNDYIASNHTYAKLGALVDFLKDNAPNLADEASIKLTDNLVQGASPEEISLPNGVTLDLNGKTTQGFVFEVEENATAAIINTGATAVPVNLGSGGPIIVPNNTALELTPNAPAKLKKLISGIAISGPSSVSAGTQTSFSARISPTDFDSTDRNVSWSSSDNSVATISGGGTLSAFRPGVTKITAQIYDSVAKVQWAQSMTLSVQADTTGAGWTVPKTLKLTAGIPRQLVIPAFSGAVLPTLSFHASKPNTLSVSTDGVLLGKLTRGNNISNVTVKDANGVKKVCKVTVVGNKFTRKFPLKQAGRAIFTSTKALSYKNGALKLEVFVLNMNKKAVRQLTGLTLELRDGDRLLYSKPVEVWKPRTKLRAKRSGVYKLTITDDMLPGVSARIFDLAGGNVHAVLVGQGVKPIARKTSNVSYQKVLADAGLPEEP